MPLLEKEGRFVAKVTAADLGQANNESQTPYVQLNFDTDEGSIAGRIWLSEKAFERSFKVLKECFGFDGNFENLNPIIDQECSITTEFEEYEQDGETKQSLRVKWINPKGGPKMEEGARKSLAQRLSIQAGFDAGGQESGEPF